MAENETTLEYEEETRATAAAEERAAELGVDITTVEGTGKGGKVTKGDVEAAANGDASEDGEEDTGKEYTDHYLVWQRTAQRVTGPFPDEEAAEAAIERVKRLNPNDAEDEYDVVTVQA